MTRPRTTPTPAPPEAAGGELGTAARSLAAVVAVLAVTGAGWALTGWSVLRPFDLDAEWRVGAWASAALLLLAAASVLRGVRRTSSSVLLLALPAFLAFMAVDELFQVHEELEGRSGIDWQLLYLPVVAAGGLAWLLALRAWGRGSTAGRLLVAAAAAWVLAQVLENLQWGPGDVEVPGYTAYVVVEEVLEAGGSALFVLAGLAALRLAPRRG